MLKRANLAESLDRRRRNRRARRTICHSYAIHDSCGEPLGICSFALDHSNLHVFLPLFTVAEPKPSLEVAVNGSWLLVSWEVLHDFPAFYRRLYTVFWATGTWWIFAVGFWRHMVVRDASVAIVCAPVRLIGSYRSLPCLGPHWLPILASPLRYAAVTALTGPRTLVSPALESRANVSGEASPEPVPKVSMRQRF